jgi:hypothetical protein
VNKTTKKIDFFTKLFYNIYRKEREKKEKRKRKEKYIRLIQQSYIFLQMPFKPCVVGSSPTLSAGG